MDVVVSQLFTGLSLGSILLLAALGLALTFGQMGVINMAHGSFIMAGSYTAYSVQEYLISNTGVALITSLIIGFLVGGLIGVLLEVTLIQHMYHRPLDTLLVTFGVGLILQLETAAAVAELEAIAAVPGVDALFLGPADLSGSLGVPGQTGHPEVLALMADAVKRCKALGKPVGTVGGTAEVVRQYRAMGFDFVAIASDLGLLMRAATGAVAELGGGAAARQVAAGGY